MKGNATFESAAGRLWLLVLLLLWAGCDLFTPRTPDDPINEAGTFTQPDAPDLVVVNLQNAIAELNTQNYRRSLSDVLTFEPTATAETRAPGLWPGWGDAEEVSYFTTLAEAARMGQGHELRLSDQVEEIGEDRFVLEATYFLTVNHRRPDAPTTVQGRLAWEIVQGADGLWRLRAWTDRELGNNPSWSDLKAAFVQ